MQPDDLLIRNGVPWATGATQLLIEPEGTHRILLAILCTLGSSPREQLALLDTAAEWSVVPDGLIDDSDLESLDLNHTLLTKLGSFEGALHRLTVHVRAHRGDDLEVDASVLVVKDWPGPVVLGFRGLLESLRFAFQPNSSPLDDALFFFGIPEVS